MLHTLDAMSYHKFNVLHWHISDDNSFPLFSKAFPNFANVSSFSQREVYRTNDIATIKKAARERGITIMFEWDMPAHARSWGKAYPNTTTHYPWGQPGCLIDPAGPESYDTITGLLKEFVTADVTGGVDGKRVAHFGGDEVPGDGNCWEGDSKVQNFAKQHGGLTNSTGGVNSTLVLSYFEKTVASTALAQGVAPVFWQGAFKNTIPDSIPKDAIFESWAGRDCGKITDAGYRCLSASGNYLDVQQPGAARYGWEDTWKDFFLNEPAVTHDNKPMSDKQLSKFLGGEGAMWGEAVDATNIDSRVWPRASAIAERLWSPALAPFPYPDTALNEDGGRLSRMRCHLIHRGVGAGPVGTNQDGDRHCSLPSTSRFMRYEGWDEL